MKFRPGQGRLLSDKDNIPFPLPKEAAPKRPLDLKVEMGAYGGGKWVEGAAWRYGGIGLSTYCFCPSTTFDLDLFGRSFAPEAIRGQVAVLDSNGNLVLHVGRIGNVDDGKPLIAAGGPPNTRSIGGDEVALFWPTDVATHSDRRLFVRDWGNARIVSVKLDYHATENGCPQGCPGDEVTHEPPRGRRDSTDRTPFSVQRSTFNGRPGAGIPPTCRFRWALDVGSPLSSCAYCAPSLCPRPRTWTNSR